ncbi:MAG: UDP-N-acetylmuramate--L-alanine ligase [Salinivirgaceae bacterium]
MNRQKNIYFVGVGGIGMSALARFYAFRGYNVAGYDLTKTKLTSALESEGISVSYTDNPETVSADFDNPATTLVVYTPAIPSDNVILNHFRQNGFELVKRAGLLGKVTEMMKGIAVAGTHGKTSISTFTAHLLYQSKRKCNAFLGGISANYKTNLLLHENAPYTVIEADEYDRSFLQLTPAIALISSIDADHLDIYGTHEKIIEAFNQFVDITRRNNGVVVVHHSVKHLIYKASQCLTYGLDSLSDYHPVDVQYVDGEYLFGLNTPQGLVSDLRLWLPGTYNFENAVAAASLALLAGISNRELGAGLLSLKGVERRFEVHLLQPTVYIDDYAHHPAEVEACIMSARAAYPDKKVVVAFQPHLFSRTRDFYSAFSASLSLADFVLLLPVYPAREQPIEGVNSQLIANEMDSEKVKVVTKEMLLQALDENRPEVFISMGAGDIGHWTEEIKEHLN